MITFTGLAALLVLLMAFGYFALRDVHRQTAAWSAQQAAMPGVPVRRPATKTHTVSGAAARWTALDDLQLDRLLADHRYC